MFLQQNGGHKNGGKPFKHLLVYPIDSSGKQFHEQQQQQPQKKEEEVIFCQIFSQVQKA